jgi:outer membrane receptor protein involved in Fe transport
MRYQVGKELSVGGQLALFHFNNILGNGKVWHTPSLRFNGDLQWNPLKELSISAYSAYVGGNYALSPSYQSIKLKPYLDIGFGAEYIVLQKLSVFLNFNNLLNNKYQRWQDYQAYGINIYGGVRLKF